MPLASKQDRLEAHASFSIISLNIESGLKTAPPPFMVVFNHFDGNSTDPSFGVSGGSVLGRSWLLVFMIVLSWPSGPEIMR